MTKRLDGEYDPLKVPVDQVIADNDKARKEQQKFADVEGYGGVPVVNEAQPKEARPRRMFPVAVRIRL